jgi:magnesium chelatase subunit D
VSEAADLGAGIWSDAATAALLLALDPVGIGGVVLRARAGPVRDVWLALLRAALPPGAPVRKVPAGIGDARLLGGLDLAATLRAGKPVTERGLLAEADSGIVVLPMAERMPSGTAARLAQVLDTGEVLGTRARIGAVALDESVDDEETLPSSLLDRLAIHLDLASVPPRAALAEAPGQEWMADARLRLSAVTVDDEVTAAVCTAAAALGVDSLRAPLFALRVARAAAALAGRDVVADEDVSLAVRLVLAPRATRLPQAPDAEQESEPPPPDDSPNDDATAPTPDEIQALADVLLEAARAALPKGLLERLQAAALARGAARSVGRAGEQRAGDARGRPIGTRTGDPRDGGRLNLVETLRAAAPWQPLRRAQFSLSATGGGEGRGEVGDARSTEMRHDPPHPDPLPPQERAEREKNRLHIRKSDFRLTRHIERRETTTIFGVDASGSSALNRLAEAKGAVELLLADCYVRRDRVAVVSFRGKVAEILLPPTRALARARRSLAGLPGGGGTPLALGIDALRALADSERRAQRTPTVVLLTDGRANVARDGSGGRPKAEAESLAAARRLFGIASLVVDTSPRPHPFAKKIAETMGGRYLPLPYANAESLSAAVRVALAPHP